MTQSEAIIERARSEQYDYLDLAICFNRVIIQLEFNHQFFKRDDEVEMMMRDILLKKLREKRDHFARIGKYPNLPELKI